MDQYQKSGNNNRVEKVGALLSVLKGPVSMSKLSELSGITQEDLEVVIKELDARAATIGLTLLREGGKIALVTHPQHSELVAAMNESDAKLGNAAKEVLAIVMYRAPVTKDEIDYLRGVNSSQTIRTLSVQGYVEESKNEKGREVYRPTVDALAALGIKERGDLPHYLEVQGKVEDHLESVGQASEA